MLPKDRWHILVVAAVVLVAGSLSFVASQSASGGGPVWKTLTGERPQVIARGGFSGLFPGSSAVAYLFSNNTSLEGVISWCDLQLTKDAVGVCLPDLNLAMCTDIQYRMLASENKTYDVNGQPMNGWFTIDYTHQELMEKVGLEQGIYSRTPAFNGKYVINTVEDVQRNVQGLWLNVENDAFYREHDLSMVNYILTLSGSVSIAYISSPDISFLKNLGEVFKGGNSSIKLVFGVPIFEEFEPSTGDSYISLLNNLEGIREFASGILVPKGYIWPLTKEGYLQPHTSIVSDAHDANLEVFSFYFSNDDMSLFLPIVYDYSYDPVREHLFFLGNEANFSLDGVVSDFPSTASEAIGCFSHLDANSTGTGTPLVISHDGDSGDFPGCTDLAYKSAVAGGADYIDCSVQVTKDGVLICLSSIDLIYSTTVAESTFISRFLEIPEIKNEVGAFTFNFTLEEIKSLKPEITAPFSDYKLVRNPINKNAGSFMTLSDFLDFAKNTSIKGVLINVENAAFLSKELGFNAVELVISAVSDAGYDDEKSLEVMIQSSSCATLIAFSEKTDYKIMYKIDGLFSDVDPSALEAIHKFADAVAVNKDSIFPTNQSFITSKTKIVSKFKSANLSVFVYLLQNEFVSAPWDFLSDPYVEIHNLAALSVDGVITDFPATAHFYRRRTCEKANFDIPLIPAGFLLDVFDEERPPPVPYPTLSNASICELPFASLGDAPSRSVAGAQPSLPGPWILLLAAFLMGLLVFNH